MLRIRFLFLAILLVWLTVSCQQASVVPTRIPTAVVPLSPAATNTLPIPPTRELMQPTSPPPPSPTALLATRRPTATAVPTINITAPGSGADVVMGSQIIAGGLARLDASQTLSVTLVSETGHRLAVGQAAISEVNSWQASLTIPQSVSGSARILAMVQDLAGEIVASDSEQINLVLDTASTNQYMALFRPVSGDQAVAGFNLFFDGRAQQPVDNVLTISLWNDECQEQVARQSFTLRGSGYWQGFLVIPRTVSGPVCAVAHFGEAGSESWREAQVSMNVVPADDENASGVVIGNPPPGSTITAGQELLLYGTAYNAVEGELVISILLENGRILAEGLATADGFGYWELSLFIPEDAVGEGQINITTGIAGEDGYAQSQNVVVFQEPQ